MNNNSGEYSEYEPSSKNDAGIWLVIFSVLALLFPLVLSLVESSLSTTSSNDDMKKKKHDPTRLREDNDLSTTLDPPPDKDSEFSDPKGNDYLIRGRKDKRIISEDDDFGNNNSNQTSSSPTSTTVSANNNNNWRCACEGGFLPPGLLQSMSGAEAVFRMTAAGQCYHLNKKNKM